MAELLDGLVGLARPRFGKDHATVQGLQPPLTPAGVVVALIADLIERLHRVGPLSGGDQSPRGVNRFETGVGAERLRRDVALLIAGVGRQLVEPVSKTVTVPLQRRGERFGLDRLHQIEGIAKEGRSIIVGAKTEQMFDGILHGERVALVANQREHRVDWSPMSLSLLGIDDGEAVQLQPLFKTQCVAARSESVLESGRPLGPLHQRDGGLTVSERNAKQNFFRVASRQECHACRKLSLFRRATKSGAGRKNFRTVLRGHERCSPNERRAIEWFELDRGHQRPGGRDASQRPHVTAANASRQHWGIGDFCISRPSPARFENHPPLMPHLSLPHQQPSGRCGRQWFFHVQLDQLDLAGW